MRNKYETINRAVAIILNRRNAPPLKTLIDVEDFEIADSIAGTWVASWQPNSKSFHAATGANGAWIKLHRVLTGAPPNMVVDHMDHDTLNNRRRSNLRVTTHAENVSHGRRKNPGKGYYWHKASGLWQVKAKGIDARQKVYGYYSSEEDARSGAERVYAELAAGRSYMAESP